MMKEKSYLMATAIIFSIIAVLHLLRVILGWYAEIGGWMVPYWLSWVALLVAGFLAYSGFKLANKK